jgi:hypothetical protein
MRYEKPAPTRGSKPGERRGGRQKGSQNKVTKALKEVILTALDKADKGGGVGYLTRQANENPAAFMALVGKVLPMTVAGDAENPLRTITVVELVAPQTPSDRIDVFLTAPDENAD